ncbi:MAG: RNA polymerase sigma factor [Gaiellaceae bacterium]
MGRGGASLEAIELVYRERYSAFARVAAATAGDGETGRDAVQQAFAIAVRERRSFRGTGPLEGWLWRIVINEARRLARERTPLQRADAEPSTNGQAVDEFGVRAWIAALPERQKDVVFLRYYADLDYRTIARLLELEVGTVSATLSAVHTKLRKALKEVER